MIHAHTATSKREMLICAPADAMLGAPHPDLWTASPVLCLHRAVDESPHRTVLLFHDAPLSVNVLLLDLCFALKHNRHTRNMLVLALLRGRHRGLLEALQAAGVDYARFVEAAPLDLEKLIVGCERLTTDDRVGHRLEELCPFLRYRELDVAHELVVCGAYLERMVLGGLRLHELCETKRHQHCELFLEPRPRT